MGNVAPSSGLRPPAPSVRMAKRKIDANQVYFSERFTSRITVFNRVFHAGFGETLEPQSAGVAQPAGQALRCRVVAGVGPPVVNPQAEAFPDDLTLGKLDKGCVDGVTSDPFDGGF